jgi:hypothetical protein
MTKQLNKKYVDKPLAKTTNQKLMAHPMDQNEENIL